MEEICASLRCSRPWLYKWVRRYSTGERNWFRDHSRRPHTILGRTEDRVERLVIAVRLELEARGVFSGAQNIAWELQERGREDIPSVRTINRILQRRGLIRQQVERYQSKGKSYPELLAQSPNAVHQTDFLGPCYLHGPIRFYSLNAVDLATGRCGAEPVLGRDAQQTIDALWQMWRRLGLPRYQQLDNEMVFYGSPAHPRGMGSILRLCLLNKVEPLFIPFDEPWRNGVVEKFNHHYRQKFLGRVTIDNFRQLQREALAFEHKHNKLYRYSKLKGRTPLEALAMSKSLLRFPVKDRAPHHPLPKPEQGRYHLIRFIRSDARLDIFGERFTVPPEAIYEYVTATVDVQRQRLAIYLHKQQVDEVPYKLR